MDKTAMKPWISTAEHTPSDAKVCQPPTKSSTEMRNVTLFERNPSVDNLTAISTVSSTINIKIIRKTPLRNHLQRYHFYRLATIWLDRRQRNYNGQRSQNLSLRSAMRSIVNEQTSCSSGAINRIELRRNLPNPRAGARRHRRWCDPKNRPVTATTGPPHRLQSTTSDVQSSQLSGQAAGDLANQSDHRHRLIPIVRQWGASGNVNNNYNRVNHPRHRSVDSTSSPPADQGDSWVSRLSPSKNSRPTPDQACRSPNNNHCIQKR